MYHICTSYAHTGKLLLQQAPCSFRSMELSLCSLRLQATSLYGVVSADVEINFISEISAVFFKKCGTFSEC